MRKKIFKKIYQILVGVTLLFSFAGCYYVFGPNSDSVTDEDTRGIAFLKGQSNFESDVKSMVNPKGVVPSPNLTSLANEKGFITKTWGQMINDGGGGNKWYEFYVYDKNTVLVVLQLSPFYYFRIQSTKFYAHFESEHNAILEEVAKAANAGNPEYDMLRGRHRNTVELFHKIGDYHVGVMISPYECYSSSNEIKYPIDGGGTYKLSEFHNAANRALYYEYDYREQTLDGHFVTAKNNGYTRKIFYHQNTTTTLSTIAKSIYTEIQFPVLIGKDLRLTDDLLGTASVYYTDTRELTKNFVVLSSTPFGDPTQGDPSAGNWVKTKPWNSSKMGNYGIVIMIRGDISKIEKSLEKEGISLDNQGSAGITLEEPVAGDMQITEIMWAGSNNDGGTAHSTTDDWIELKNISAKYLTLQNIRLSREGSSAWNITGITLSLAPGEAAVIARTGSNLFSEKTPAKIFVSSSVSLSGSSAYNIVLYDKDSNQMDIVNGSDHYKSACYSNGNYYKSVDRSLGWGCSTATVTGTTNYTTKVFGTPGD